MPGAVLFLARSPGMWHLTRDFVGQLAKNKGLKGEWLSRASPVLEVFSLHDFLNREVSMQNSL